MTLVRIGGTVLGGGGFEWWDSGIGPRVTESTIIIETTLLQTLEWLEQAIVWESID